MPLLRSLGDDVLVDYRGRSGGPECELTAGDRVVVSPLSKPVVGMKVLLRDDASAVASTLGPREALTPATLVYAVPVAARAIPASYAGGS